MRTYVYVDALNLYYGSVKGTPYKWLDLKAAFGKVLARQNKILKIKYFTAMVDGRFDADAPSRQNSYLCALKAHTPEVEVYEGHFLTHEKSARRVDDPSRFVQVLVPEEKGSDVNLAVHLLNDAWLDVYDCAVVVSNDSDLAEALRMVRNDRGKVVGITPPGKNRPTARLQQNSNFVRPLRRGVLSVSQLPSPIPGTNFHKPPSW